MDKPNPPQEAVLIRLARQASRIKAPAAARTADISTARWSQIENGYEARGGRYKPVSAPAHTIAWMAYAVGLEPERLAVPRPDAAVILREILRRQAPEPQDGGPPDDEPDPEPLTPDERRSVSAFLKAIRQQASGRDGLEEGDDSA